MPPSPAVFPSSELGFALEDYGQPVGAGAGQGVLAGERPDHLSTFSSDLSKFLRYRRLRVRRPLHLLTMGMLLGYQRACPRSVENAFSRQHARRAHCYAMLRARISCCTGVTMEPNPMRNLL